MRSKLLTNLIAAVIIMLLARPTTATVIVAAEDLGGCIVEFTYDSSDESSLIRAFGLDITVDHGATIESIFDCSPYYNVYPGSIVIGDGGVDDSGSPVAEAGSFGALGGLGTGGITIEMGSLYIDPEDAPPVSDSLFKLGIDLHDASMANINIALNTVRGGIVMEDTGCNPTIDLIGCTVNPEPATILLLTFGTLMLRRKNS